MSPSNSVDQPNLDYAFPDVNSIKAELERADPSKDFSSLEDADLILTYRKHIGESLKSSLIRRNCNAGSKHARKYEVTCFRILQVTLATAFYNDKPIMSYQPTSMRFDEYKQEIRDITLLLNPKDKDGNHIWNTLKNDHGVHSLVFECKNYNYARKAIRLKSREIYQLYQYLTPSHKKSHGQLGIFLTREGERIIDASGKSALCRLWEDGYRLLVFKDNDLRDLIDGFISIGNCESVFARKVNDKLDSVVPYGD